MFKLRFPGRGWRGLLKDNPELLLLPLPLIFLVEVHWSLICVPILLFWIMGSLWEYPWEKIDE